MFTNHTLKLTSRGIDERQFQNIRHCKSTVFAKNDKCPQHCNLRQLAHRSVSPFSNLDNAPAIAPPSLPCVSTNRKSEEQYKEAAALNMSPRDSSPKPMADKQGELNNNNNNNNAPKVGLRERLKHFTWAWFLSTMSTGGFSIALAETPHKFHGTTATQPNTPHTTNPQRPLHHRANSLHL